MFIYTRTKFLCTSSFFGIFFQLVFKSDVLSQAIGRASTYRNSMLQNMSMGIGGSAARAVTGAAAAATAGSSDVNVSIDDMPGMPFLLK